MSPSMEVYYIFFIFVCILFINYKYNILNLYPLIIHIKANHFLIPTQKNDSILICEISISWPNVIFGIEDKLHVISNYI